VQKEELVIIIINDRIIPGKPFIRSLISKAI